MSHRYLLAHNTQARTGIRDAFAVHNGQGVHLATTAHNFEPVRLIRGQIVSWYGSDSAGAVHAAKSQRNPRARLVA